MREMWVPFAVENTHEIMVLPPEKVVIKTRLYRVLGFS
tara:strand:- start:67 stop:180 length:114 start_codon:yes stop_codon:yes gene_type:complete